VLLYLDYLTSVREGAVGDMAFVLEDLSNTLPVWGRWPVIFLSGQKDFPLVG